MCVCNCCEHVCICVCVCAWFSRMAFCIIGCNKSNCFSYTEKNYVTLFVAVDSVWRHSCLFVVGKCWATVYVILRNRTHTHRKKNIRTTSPESVKAHHTLTLISMSYKQHIVVHLTSVKFCRDHIIIPFTWFTVAVQPLVCVQFIWNIPQIMNNLI